MIIWERGQFSDWKSERKLDEVCLYDEPSNEDLGIKPYPWWIVALVWAGLLLAGLLVWIGLAKAVF